MNASTIAMHIGD